MEGTMATRIEEQLEAIKRELGRQDEQWEQAKSLLAGLGNVWLSIPREQLEEIHEATRLPSRPVFGVRV
jgi:hypothetical protein